MDDQPSALSPRQDRILSTVCRHYILRGEPISSSGLQRAYGIGWSSATIRQDLAALERAGLLHRPHRSAGSLPTQLGMQLYVDRLVTDAEPAQGVKHAVDRSLAEVGSDPAADVRVAARVLSEVSGCAAVSFVGSSRIGVIADVDVVPLVGPRALVVLSMEPTGDGSGDTSLMVPVSLDGLCRDRGTPQLTAEDQTQLAARLRWLCRGRTLGGARQRLETLQREREASVDAVLAEALRIGLLLCVGASLDPLFVQVAGQPMLARGRLQLEALAEVLELLEDVHRLADVLCQVIPEGGAEAGVRARVQMGAEGLVAPPGTGDAVGEGLTLVGCRLPTSGTEPGRRTKTGAVAVLGSDRMDYAAVVPLVEYAARALAARTGE